MRQRAERKDTRGGDPPFGQGRSGKNRYLVVERMLGPGRHPDEEVIDPLGSGKFEHGRHLDSPAYVDY